MSGFIVYTYWTMKCLGIYNRGVIDNHFIPCSNTVCKRTMQQQCQKHSKIPFYMRASTTFQVLKQQNVLPNKLVCRLKTIKPFCTFCCTLAKLKMYVWSFPERKCLEIQDSNIVCQALLMEKKLPLVWQCTVQYTFYSTSQHKKKNIFINI